MNQETLLLLNAARARGQDDALPEVAAALEAAHEDEAVLAWMASTRANDATIGAAVRSIDPPREFDLAKAKQRLVLGISRRSLLLWPTAAAAAAVAGGAYWQFIRRRISFNALSERLADISSKGVTLSLMSMDAKLVHQWLVDSHSPLALSLPDKLSALPRKGCHLYDLDGHAVSLECFLLPGMKELHLFTIDSAELRGAPVMSRRPSFTAKQGMTIATWTSDTHTLLMLSREPKAIIQGLVG
jgi:hypothetical protein